MGVEPVPAVLHPDPRCRPDRVGRRAPRAAAEPGHGPPLRPGLGGVPRPAALWVYGEDADLGLAGYARFEWAAIDVWYEEDEQVFVHPREPYTRVDALRSTRHVRVELDGTVVAESASPVLVFETGLPTRYYLNRSEVDFTHLAATDTVTACPYKRTTSGYWTAEVGGHSYPDIASTYDFPTRQLLPIAGLVAFYNEKVDLVVDGRRLGRPSHTSPERPTPSPGPPGKPRNTLGKTVAGRDANTP